MQLCVDEMKEPDVSQIGGVKRHVNFVLYLSHIHIKKNNTFIRETCHAKHTYEYFKKGLLNLQ